MCAKISIFGAMVSLHYVIIAVKHINIRPRFSILPSGPCEC